MDHSTRIETKLSYPFHQEFGSFYLHCDPSASHYLKLILDSIFCSQGGDFLNEIKPCLEQEKEQIVDAHIEGQRVFDNYQHTQWTTDQAEQYYNETYK